MLSIFNNGSKLWILFILGVIWVAIWGYRTYVSQKSGYNQQTDAGIVDIKTRSIWTNGNFYLLLIGIAVIAGFMIWINGDYQ